MSFPAVHPYTFCPKSDCGEQIVISALSQARKRFNGTVWHITCPHCDGDFEIKENEFLHGVFSFDEESGKLKQAILADQLK